MENIKEKLLAATTVAVATHGLDGATTRKIAEIANVADTNIYRFFNSRDELLFTAYKCSSGALINMVLNEIDRLKDNKMGLHLRDCAHIVFQKVWHFLVDNSDVCKCHSFYYHSTSFEQYAMDFHNEQVRDLTEHLSWLFWNEDDAKRCINYIFILVYDSAKLVVDGQLPNNEETADKIFNDMFNMLICQSNRWPFRNQT